MRRTILVITLSCLCCVALASPPRLPFDVLYDLVRLYVGTTDDAPEDNEELRNSIARAYANPINWNSATHAQLADLLFLSDNVIDELQYYVYQHGDVRSIDELRLVPLVDYKLCEILSSLMYVTDTMTSASWSDAFRHTSHRIVSRTDVEAERRAGYDDGSYPGPPFRQLLKYQAEASSSFSAAITMESDAGEPWDVRGFDLYRGFAQFSSFLNDSRVVAGTFRVSSGSGLVFGGNSYGNLASRLRNIRSYSNIRGYAGVSGSPTLNGVAAQISPTKALTVTALYGYSPIDAHLTYGTWSSVIDDDMHRTPTERANNHALRMHTVAGRLQYRHRCFSLGATGYAGFFSAPSTIFGSRQWAASIDYSAHHGCLSFSGETSICQSSGIATTNFLSITPLSDLSFILNIRYFSPGYHSFWADTYARNDHVSGEQGASFYAIFPLYRYMTLDLFADVSRNTMPTSYLYGTPLDYELRTQYSASFANSGTLALSLRFRQQNSLYLPDDGHVSSVSCDQAYQLKAEYRCPLSNGFRTNSGMQMSLARDLKSEWSAFSFGWLIYQDIDYEPLPNRLLFRLRMALFDTPLWANRFYLSEANLAESSYSPVLYGEGFRWYLIAKYSAPFGLSAQFRVAQTIYADRDTIGTGHDKTDSPHRTEFNILLAYRF